jgi:hypothetical protein
MWPPALPGSAPVPPPPRQRPRYSKFAALVFSFFSPSLYRDVARNWRGIGVLYLLLLLTLTWIPVLARWHHSVRAYAYGGAAASTLREFPTITINKGVVSIAEEEPYFWRAPRSGEVILYVDTTGSFDKPEAAQAKILLGSSAVEVRNTPRETRVYDLSEVNYFFIDKHKMVAWTHWFSDRLVLLGLPTALLVSFIWGLVRLLLYALIGLIFASIFNARLDFTALMRLAAVAMTPGMVLDTPAWTFNFGWSPCCAWSALIGIMTLIYLGFAVKANADAAPPPPGMYVPGRGYPVPGGHLPSAT